MNNGLVLLKKARYYSSVGFLYGATLLFAWYIFQPSMFSKNTAYSQPLQTQPPSSPVLPKARPVIIGKPVRIVIKEADNGLDIDLPVEDGTYDEATASWSLGERSAHFALISTPANDNNGNTLIYGHNNKHVFGHLPAIHENVGAFAQIYTDNGHIFTYSYQTTAELEPDDTSVLDNSGPPMLVVQTCSGSFYEYRRMFYFKFDKVEG